MCCAKPKEDCEQTHLCESHQDTLNRFRALNVHCTELCYSSDEENPHCHHEGGVVGRKGTETAEYSCPYELADDTLGEAFEYVKELQVPKHLLACFKDADLACHRR